jgi:hypothetical protein
MKKIKFHYLTLRASLLVAFLAVLGFSACDGEDVQPEYGVPVVRDKAIRLEQQTNDAIVKENTETITTKED